MRKNISAQKIHKNIIIKTFQLSQNDLRILKLKRLLSSSISLPAKKTFAALGSIVLLLSVYLSGVWSGVNVPKSYAEFIFADSEGLVKEYSSTLKVLPVIGTGQLLLKIEEENLFAMPLDQVEKVFEKKRLEMTEALIDLRAEKIKAYLQEKKSPWADASQTIARQSHWRLILAIAFAESSWGRNCVDNNCSNIGVEPGHELWRKYKTYDDWIVDFNKLLERRYKDWTLNEMCGVYVKPCNKNWLLATSQVLEELKEEGIN